MYKTDRSCIIGVFVIPGQKDHPFRPGEESSFEKAVDFALRASFNDFNFRTLKKITGKQIPPDCKGNPQTITDYLVDHLKSCGFQKQFALYFNTAAPDAHAFDDWHNKTCCLFLDALTGTGLYEKILYGKAQKIVNMMFKHLYCLSGAEAYEAHFRHCHVTLDNFTLEWFKRYIPPYKRIESWSNLVYKDPFSDPSDYLFYQHHIRIFFQTAEGKKQYASLTPFQAEFYIWREIQLRLAAEAFTFELQPDDYKGNSSFAQVRKKEIRALSVEKLIATVETAITDYKAKSQ